jgi:rhodanese-related sulfurtransferase
MCAYRPGKIIQPLAAAFILASAMGCGKAEVMTKGEMTVTEFKEWRKNTPQAMVIDVREPEELRGELKALPEVKNVPLSQLVSRWREIPKDQPVALICRSGNRSEQAKKFLLSKGYSKVINVLGGMQAYRAAEGLSQPAEGSQ